MSDGIKDILEPGGTEVPTAAGGTRWYRKPLKTFRWSDLQNLFTESLAGWNRHKAPRLGAALAFYALLSLAPLLLVVASVAGLALGHQAAEHDIVTQVQQLAGPEGGKAVEALLETSRKTTHGIVATAFGLLTLLFGASGVLIELRDALNTIWEVPNPELSFLKKVSTFAKERLFSFALVLAIGFLLIVSLAISAFISAVGALSASLLPADEFVLHILNLLVSFIVITGLFSAIYKFVPDIRIEWRDVLLGGAVTSMLFSLGKLLLGLYLGKATFASSYGAAASIVVLIVWVYYSGQIFFLGAEFTKTFANHYGSQPNRHPEAMVTDTNNGLNARSPSEPEIIKPPESRKAEHASLSGHRS